MPISSSKTKMDRPGKMEPLPPSHRPHDLMRLEFYLEELRATVLKDWPEPEVPFDWELHKEEWMRAHVGDVMPSLLLPKFKLRANPLIPRPMVKRLPLSQMGTTDPEATSDSARRASTDRTHLSDRSNQGGDRSAQTFRLHGQLPSTAASGSQQTGWTSATRRESSSHGPSSAGVVGFINGPGTKDTRGKPVGLFQEVRGGTRGSVGTSSSSFGNGRGHGDKRVSIERRIVSSAGGAAEHPGQNLRREAVAVQRKKRSGEKGDESTRAERRRRRKNGEGGGVEDAMDEEQHQRGGGDEDDEEDEEYVDGIDGGLMLSSGRLPSSGKAITSLRGARSRPRSRSYPGAAGNEEDDGSGEGDIDVDAECMVEDDGEHAAAAETVGGGDRLNLTAIEDRSVFTRARSSGLPSTTTSRDSPVRIRTVDCPHCKCTVKVRVRLGLPSGRLRGLQSRQCSASWVSAVDPVKKKLGTPGVAAWQLEETCTLEKDKELQARKRHRRSTIPSPLSTTGTYTESRPDSSPFDGLQRSCHQLWRESGFSTARGFETKEAGGTIQEEEKRAVEEGARVSPYDQGLKTMEGDIKRMAISRREQVRIQRLVVLFCEGFITLLEEIVSASLSNKITVMAKVLNTFVKLVEERMKELYRSELMQLMSSNEKTIRKLIAQMEQKMDGVHKREALTALVYNELKETKAAIEAEKEKRAAAEGKCKEMEQDMVVMRETIERYKVLNKGTEQEIKDLMEMPAKLANMTKRLHDKELQLQQIVSENADLQRLKDIAEKKSEEYQKKMEAASQNARHAREEVTALQKRMEEEEATKKIVDEELAITKQKLEIFRDLGTHNGQMYEQTLQALEEEKKENKLLQRKVEELNREIERLRARVKVEVQLRQRDAVRKWMEEREREFGDKTHSLEKDKETLAKENEKYRQQMEELGKDVLRLEEELHKIDVLEAALSTKEKEVLELQGVISDLRKGVAHKNELQQRVEDLYARVKFADKERKALERDKEELELQMRELTQQLMVSRSQMQANSQKLVELKAEVNRYRTRAQEAAHKHAVAAFRILYLEVKIRRQDELIATFSANANAGKITAQLGVEEGSLRVLMAELSGSLDGVERLQKLIHALARVMDIQTAGQGSHVPTPEEGRRELWEEMTHSRSMGSLQGEGDMGDERRDWKMSARVADLRRMVQDSIAAVVAVIRAAGGGESRTSKTSTAHQAKQGWLRGRVMAEYLFMTVDPDEGVIRFRPPAFSIPFVERKDQTRSLSRGEEGRRTQQHSRLENEEQVSKRRLLGGEEEGGGGEKDGVESDAGSKKGEEERRDKDIGVHGKTWDQKFWIDELGSLCLHVGDSNAGLLAFFEPSRKSRSEKAMHMPRGRRRPGHTSRSGLITSIDLEGETGDGPSIIPGSSATHQGRRSKSRSITFVDLEGEMGHSSSVTHSSSATPGSPAMSSRSNQSRSGHSRIGDMVAKAAGGLVKTQETTENHEDKRGHPTRRTSGIDHGTNPVPGSTRPNKSVVNTGEAPSQFSHRRVPLIKRDSEHWEELVEGGKQWLGMRKPKRPQLGPKRVQLVLKPPEFGD